MKPGFTMAEAVDVGKKIKMRRDRIDHLNKEMITIQDKIRIMEDEIEFLQPTVSYTGHYTALPSKYVPRYIGDDDKA